MPAPILTLTTVVGCGHQTVAGPPPVVAARVKIMGAPALTTASMHPCPLCTAAPTPCGTVQWTPGAARVKAMGVPVLTTASVGTAANKAPATLTQMQQRVVAT